MMILQIHIMKLTIYGGGTISIGNKIGNITSYKGYDLTSLPNGSEVRYLYDHQNLGCYKCITSGNYQPAVEFIDGKLRRTYVTNDGELLIDINDSGQMIYENGTTFSGTLPAGNYLISPNELQKRRLSVYTAIAKHRNSLYKTNDYVNR